MFLNPDFSYTLGNFGDSAINKGNIAYFFTAHARNDDISTSDLRTFIGKSKYAPYFYFRFIWPTDLESVPRVEPPTLIISVINKGNIAYDYPSPSYSVVGADTLRGLVTLTFDLLTLDSGPPSFKILRLSVLDL